MELLLNLAWLLLALPAYWLWRRRDAARLARRVGSLECLLALGCVLVLLFPVISASDDLHAMRAEMEDSSVNKRAERQAGTDKSSTWVSRLQGPPALVAYAAWMAAPKVSRVEVCVPSFSPLAAPCRVHAGRAPPFSLLA